METEKNVKEHWIRNTRLAKYCQKNEKFRKAFGVVVGIVLAVCIICTISYIAELNTAKSIASSWRTDYWLDKVLSCRIKLGISIVIGFIDFYYGIKIIKKD